MPTECLDLFGPAMQGILDCAEQALIDCNRPAGLVHLAPGAEVAHDNCCDPGGQLWVRLVEVYPSAGPGAAFPALDSQQQCGITMLAARIGIGVVRCAHVIDDQGNPPTAEEMTADTLGMTRDASILLQAIQCCVPSVRGVQTMKVQNWLPSGPLGGCVGGEWQIVVGLDFCGCLPDEAP